MCVALQQGPAERLPAWSKQKSHSSRLTIVRKATLQDNYGDRWQTQPAARSPPSHHQQAIFRMREGWHEVAWPEEHSSQALGAGVRGGSLRQRPRMTARTRPPFLGTEGEKERDNASTKYPESPVSGGSKPSCQGLLCTSSCHGAPRGWRGCATGETGSRSGILVTSERRWRFEQKGKRPKAQQTCKMPVQASACGFRPPAGWAGESVWLCDLLHSSETGRVPLC